MNRFVDAILIAVNCILVAPPALAQYVHGNEAVTIGAAGRTVETPPIQGRAGKLCRSEDPCHAGVWRMVETADGLVECTEAYAREGTCRPSTYGVEKLRRLWVVKKGDLWLQCQYPDLVSKCVDMNATPLAKLPVDAVQ